VWAYFVHFFFSFYLGTLNITVHMAHTKVTHLLKTISFTLLPISFLLTPSLIALINVCFVNGGDGIEVYRSDNVDVYNNVCYMNQQDEPQTNGTKYFLSFFLSFFLSLGNFSHFFQNFFIGELTATYFGNVTFINNIVYGQPRKAATNTYNYV
jgi:hypothetical protein